LLLLLQRHGSWLSVGHKRGAFCCEACRHLEASSRNFWTSLKAVKLTGVATTVDILLLLGGPVAARTGPKQGPS
jgi:hypothetical protein